MLCTGPLTGGGGRRVYKKVFRNKMGRGGMNLRRGQVCESKCSRQAPGSSDATSGAQRTVTGSRRPKQNPVGSVCWSIARLPPTIIALPLDSGTLVLGCLIWDAWGRWPLSRGYLQPLSQRQPTRVGAGACQASCRYLQGAPSLGRLGAPPRGLRGRSQSA